MIATLVPEGFDPLDAWSISVPEIIVPEEADKIVLRVERERLSERATERIYPTWDVWIAKVKKILDGDRVIINVLKEGLGEQEGKGKTREVRLASIICPRKDQPRWQAARKLTARLLLGKKVTFLMLRNESAESPLQYEDSTGLPVGWEPLEYEDSIGLPVGWPFLDEVTPLNVLIKMGLARHYERYSADPELARLEDEARKARRGIWAETNHQLKNQSQR